MTSIPPSAERLPDRSGRSKRILLTTFGSLGDLYPFLAIASGLKARGHFPIIGTSATYRGRVEERGIAFAPIRPDLPDSEAMPELMRTVMDARRGTEEVVRQAVLPFLRDSYEDTLAAADGADLLISHLLTFATPLVAELRGLPWASTALQPISLFSALDPPALAQAPWLSRLPFLRPWFWRLAMAGFSRISHPWFASLRSLRKELGLPASNSSPLLNGHSPHLVLALFSPLLAPPQPDWPRQTVITGFPFLDPPGGPLPTMLEEFLSAGPPPIVFTLGSSAVMTPGTFYAESAAAAAILGDRAVLLAGRDAATLEGTLPKGVIAIDYAPHAALFPRASAIVHQGGIGTTAEAMRAGKPMLVMPFAHDQFDNARRVERLGIGSEIRRGRYTAKQAARQLRPLLQESGYRRRAAEVGVKVRGEESIKAACDAIEGLLTRDMAG